MITHAKLKHFGVPALKVRRFASTIKGEPVERALAILDLQPSPTCQTLGKLLRSAVANAMNNHQLSPEYLLVSNVLVDQGPTMKRIRPRARGRAYRVMKRSSHVTIELDLIESQRTAPAKEVIAQEKPRSKSKPTTEKAAAKKTAKASPAKKKTAGKAVAKPKPTKAKAGTTKDKAKPEPKKAKPKLETKNAKPKTAPKKGEDKE
jgi:large subunit ribosomal protein L22